MRFELLLNLSRPFLAAAFVAGAAVAAPSAQAWEISWGGGAQVTGSGKPASQARAVSGFEAIAVRGPVKLVVRQSGREAVLLQGDDNLLPLIETVVEERKHGRTLVIGLRKGTSVNTRTDIVATVDAVRLKAVSSAGSGDVEVQALKTPSFALDLAGSADAQLTGLQTEALEISVSGSGDVRASGSATRVKIGIAGSGSAAFASLQADDVTVSIAGSGDAEVVANKTLAVSVAGSGDVVYRGNGQLVKNSVAGSGSVTHR